MYTIYYTQHDRPNATQVGVVSAPNHLIAHQVARQQFINSKIEKITELKPTREFTHHHGARFINGEFRPVNYEDEIM